MALTPQEYQDARSALDTIYAQMGIDYRNAWSFGNDTEQRINAFFRANPSHWITRQFGGNPVRLMETLSRQQRALSGYDSAGSVAPGNREAFLREQADLLRGGTSTLRQAQTAEDAGAAQAPADPNKAESDKLTDWISRFTQMMSEDVGPGDPLYDSLTKLGANRASAGVGASGIRTGRGGLGDLAIQQGAMNAAVPYIMQRQQMAQAGLGLLDQRGRGLEALRQGAAGLQLQQAAFNNNVANQMYGQQADAAGGTGGVVGGILGGLAGGIATVATGGAAAPAIPGLIAGGSSVGAGLGQSGVRRPTMQTVQSYGASRGGSGF